MRVKVELLNTYKYPENIVKAKTSSRLPMIEAKELYKKIAKLIEDTEKEVAQKYKAGKA